MTEMEQQFDFKPKKIAYDFIINASAKLGDSVGAGRSFPRMQQTSIRPDQHTYNCLLNAHAKVGDAEQAERVIQEMQ